MMLKHDLGRWPRKVYGLQYVVTKLGVDLNHTVFEFVQLTGLAENLGRYTDLADVVNQSGHTDSFGLFLRKAHLVGDGIGQSSYPPLVTSRVGILHLDC